MTFVGSYWDWFQTTEEEGCSILNDANYNVGANYYDLYELDPITEDTYITTLYVPSGAMTLSCDREGCPNNYGPWQTTSANSITSADYRVVVRGMLCLDGKGC